MPTATRSRGRPSDPASNRAGISPWVCPRSRLAGTGRFTVPNVPTGCDYSLVAESGAMISQRRFAFKDAAVRPGETTDVGDIQLKD